MAVCNLPVERDRLIEALGEALPGTRLHIVRVTPDTVDPLDLVASQVGPNPDGPIMLVDLEKALPSNEKNHPVIHALNLRRPQWPAQVPQPVVFWVPDYLVGLLGREAPDFFDWRSDTLFFPNLSETALRPLLSALWDGGLDGRMSELDRRQRLHELRSRLALPTETEHPYVLSTRASWLLELGRHLRLLGELDEAGHSFRESLKISERLGRQEGIADATHSLGIISAYRGDLEDADRLFRKSLEIDERLGRQEETAEAYSRLGIISACRGDLDAAERLYRKGLEIDERLGRQEGIAAAYHNLGTISQVRGDLDEAERLYRKSLEISERVGLAEIQAAAHSNLSALMQRQLRTGKGARPLPPGDER